MNRLSTVLACALAAACATGASAERVVLVESSPPPAALHAPPSAVLLAEQSRNGFATGHPTMVELHPGFSVVDRSAVIDARPGDVVELNHAVPVPRAYRVGAANSATNPTGTELLGQNGGQ